jgi:uncharacterized SAM-binding protein YcdF (DUF218 family)
MFIASKILALITQPLAWVMALLLLSLLLPARRVQWARATVALALLLLALLGWEPLPDAGIRYLENQFPEIPLSADLTPYAGVVVLGGALDAGYVAQARAQPVLNSGAERMTMTVALLQRHPHLQAVFTGGEGRLFAAGPTEAQRADVFFATLGVATGRVQLEDQSRNTFENAVLSSQLPGIDPKRPWLLLTSAWHMPRSMATFQHAGWNVHAYPVDFRTGAHTPWTAYSLREGITRWQLLLHEWVGRVAYRMAGRT